MKMTDTDLLRVLEAESKLTHAYQSDLVEERVKSFRAYMREPYGNEEEGRSAVVSSDVFDAVEGMLPDLIEVFTSSDKAVVFEPVGAEDEQGAEQVTNACNYVFYKQNNGFLILYTALKDALMLKTGGIKWYWDKKRTPDFTMYKSVSEMQLAAFLAANPDAEVIEQEETVPPDEEAALAQAYGVELPKYYTVKIKTVKEKGICKVVAIPPDELEVSRRHNSILLDECPYVAHVTVKTLSDILDMGYKVEASDVRAAKNRDGSEYDIDREEDQRINDQTDDESMVSGYLRDEYILCDFDGDGIAERRRVVRLGQLILENIEVSHVPIAAWTPYILTHSFKGLSVAELVEEFQRIHTTILRNQLDNLALANNQETVVLTDAQGNPQANIDDLLNRRPGGVLREKVPNAVRPYAQGWQGIQAQPMLEQLSQEKENRTGWTRYSQGLDGDSLNKTATGAQMIMNASQKRMKLMARIAAECLVMPMFRGIFKTLTDNCMEKLAYRLNGKFVEYDPQEWRDQYDMTVNVGIGTGDVQQQSAFLMQIAQAQAAVAGSPMAKKLLDPKKVYNVQARLAENAGFKNANEFWVDPDTVPDTPPAPPPVDPKVMIEQAKLKDAQMRGAAEMQADAQKTQAEMAQAERMQAAEFQFKADQAALDRQLELEKEELRNQTAERMKVMDLTASAANKETQEQIAQLQRALAAIIQSQSLPPPGL